MTPYEQFVARNGGGPAFEEPARTTPRAGHRKNGTCGYKAVVTFPPTPHRPLGRTYQPVRHNFKTADEARAYAEKWIAANSKA